LEITQWSFAYFLVTPIRLLQKQTSNDMMQWHSALRHSVKWQNVPT
jgi:hypothetical protein